MLPTKKLGPLLALLIVFGTAELGLRFGYHRVGVVLDPELGELVNAPGIARWGREGHGTSHWTDHGVRGALAPRMDQPRVLVLGDSFTDALQVDDGEAFTAIAEERLRVAGSRVQVLNAGFSGRSMADHVALAPKLHQLLYPEWTVVVLTDQDVTTDAWDEHKNHFELEGLQLRVVRVPPREPRGALRALHQLRRQSSLLDYTVVRLGELWHVAKREAPLFRAADVAHGEGAAKSEERSFPVEAELDALIDACGGRLSLLWLSSFDPATPAQPTSVEARVATHAASRNIAFTATRGRFGELGERAPFGFADSGYNQGHLNVHGHRIAGALLAEELLRRGVDGVR